MEKILSGNDRRNKIIELIKNSDKPLSGSELGRLTGVSRQVIVQDMALLRTQGITIVSTPKGYVINDESSIPTRLIKVRHTTDELPDELNTIVDLGGCVVDVIVNHKTYGKLSCPLNIKSRRDVMAFLNDITSGKSTPLMNVTSGYHFHHISAESDEIIDEIINALNKKGYLAEFLPYEESLT